MHPFRVAFGTTALAAMVLGGVLLPPNLPSGVYTASLDGDDTTLKRVGDLPQEHPLSALACAASVDNLSTTTFNITRTSEENTTPSIQKRDTTGCTWRNLDYVQYYLSFQNAWVSPFRPVVSLPKIAQLLYAAI